MKKVHWYYKFLILFLIFFSMFFLFNKTVTNLVNSSSYKNYVNYLNVSFNNLFKFRTIASKNKSLEKEIANTKVDQLKLDNLTKENQELKELLNLKGVYSDYYGIYSKVISRNKMYWYSTFTIDKGEKDGIKEGSAVVTKDGLIGKVKNVNKDFSTVELVTSSSKDNKISVSINSNKVGLIDNYEHPYLKIILTTDEKGIKEGDKVVTSGLGNLPKNIYVGKVKKIERDSLNLSYILYAELGQDINNISYVMVLNNK